MKNILYCLLLFLVFISCFHKLKDSRNVLFFRDTPAFELAKAISKGNLRKIENIVKKNPSLLEIPNPVTGSNVLVLSIYEEDFAVFKQLLELGANPNFINPFTKYCVLIDAIKPFGSQFKWRIDTRYVETLLEYGANANYVMSEDFVNQKGHRSSAKSVLAEASSLDLKMVKILIANGADPNKKIGNEHFTAFSQAVQGGKIEIINYYVDSLKVDIHQPMATVLRKPSNTKVTYHIQDYIVNKFIKAKLMGDVEEMARLKLKHEGIEEANQELWQLIKKLENLGVDFKNYEYK